MTYILDTDVLSNLMRRVPSTALIRRLASVPPVDQATTSITLGELIYGTQRVPDQRDSLLAGIDAVIGSDLPVLPFDDGAARRYGPIRAELEAAGTPIGDADLRIAAIALAHGHTVVTGNVRHFRMVPGLAVENWLSE